MPASFFYAALGETLHAHQVNSSNATLHRTSATSLPARVQYAWAHPEKALLYVASSNGGPRDPGDCHHASAFEIDPASGKLSLIGTPTQLPARPIHCTVDRRGEYLLIAYNIPSMLSVHRIMPEGAIGERVEQSAALDFDVYSHQVMVTPSNRTVVMPARGLDDSPSRPADTGCLKVFDFTGGQLSGSASISPYAHFGPRHLDFHPNDKWMYLSVERQSQLQMYSLQDGAAVAARPSFTCSSLSRERTGKVRQIACAVHVHPNGKFVYQSNRSDGFTTEGDGWTIGHIGEDTIAVYAIDQTTGEPSVIQHVDVPSVHTRTFSIHPSGELLVAATIQPVPVRTQDGGIKVVPAALMVYRIADDGRLSLARSYEQNTLGKIMFWTGMITIP